MKTPHALLSLLLLAPACDHSGDDPLPEEPAALAHDEAPVGEAISNPRGASPEQASPPRAAKNVEPRPTMPGARAAFEELSQLVEAEYVDGPLSEDEVWTGAMEGVLARLVQLQGHQINTLLPPRKHEELLVGTQGQLVGVGVMIERVADVVVVREVIGGGPAERAGLQAGDRILGVDGDRLKDLPLHEVVDRIRGSEGSTVDLFVQRDTEEWTETVTRGLVEVASVQGAALEDGVGYLRITSFGEGTTAELDARLQALADEGVTSMILDLRYCPGGLLDASLETIARFVPPGETLLTVQPREGEAEIRRSEGEHPWQTRPLAVLVGPKTASSAEILADAIQEHDRGPLVGETTMGKHTIEAVHELSGGWAVKLSVSRFSTASGEDRQGVGVSPDIRIPSPPGAGHERVPIRELDPAADPVLATAVGLLRGD